MRAARASTTRPRGAAGLVLLPGPAAPLIPRGKPRHFSAPGGHVPLKSPAGDADKKAMTTKETAMTETTTLHPFEKAGLGKAPFRCVGYAYKTYQACHGAPVQVGASCDVCGTGIKHVFFVRSADGREFKTGSECVLKTRDAALKSEVKRERAKARREARDAKYKALRERELETNRAAAAAFAAEHGLTEALTCSHYIVADIRARLERWGSITEKQVALVKKLHAEETAPKAAAAEAPTGRRAVCGIIKSIKLRETNFGPVEKVVVEVTEDDGGVWRTWGTLPAALAGGTDPVLGRAGAKVGDTVAFTATFTPADDDKAFAFYKRPAAAKVVEKGSN